ncbi:MAG: glycoside hydrolase family 3 protein, partial [Rhodospirillales bacterium]|nr:glycoside hydrolase family 3 protein [Rhodospirillales bacterium]
MNLPVVFSLSGPVLTSEEKSFFQEVNPFGFILFRRNIETPAQLRSLTDSLRDLTQTPDIPILIDQEGGRVQRLSQPHWPQYPCMQDCTNTAHLTSTLTNISRDLKAAGINVNCAPVLDVLTPATDQSIGNRAFSEDPDIVASCGIQSCAVFLQNGIQPIVKHLPGHGRAEVDSHKELPIVKASLADLQRTDFLPFQRVLAQPFAAQLWGMIGHCLYPALDPDFPASLSATIIRDIIRGTIGFPGLLFSDDLSMGALARYGDVAECARLCL